MKTVKVENNQHLVRDMDTNAVLNTNISGLQAHLRQRDRLNKIDDMEIKIDSLETKMDLILQLLQNK